jgi:hypothetical protein
MSTWKTQRAIRPAWRTCTETGVDVAQARELGWVDRHGGGQVVDGEAPRKRKISVGSIVAFIFGIVLVVGIFVYAIPKFANYGDIWAAMKTLTPLEFWSRTKPG